jgi:hypothetical protein
MKINTFDIDGVIYFGDEVTGVRPCEDDIIITGRPYHDREETVGMLEHRGIYNKLYMNPLDRDDSNYGREASGIFKAHTLTMLMNMGYEIAMHFEDDPIQIEEIKKVHPNLQIVHLVRENEEYVKY